MKRYLVNLALALAGRNPFRSELERVKEEYEKTAEKVRLLSDYHIKAQEAIEETRKQTRSYQVLIENLRERLKEKDELINQMNKGAETGEGK